MIRLKFCTGKFFLEFFSFLDFEGSEHEENDYLKVMRERMKEDGD